MDEIQRLIMQVEGEAKITALTKDLAAQTSAMRDLKKQYDEGLILTSQYKQGMEAAAKAAAPLAAQLRATERSLKTLGPTLLQTGYLVDDFVAGLNNRGMAGALSNVQNNIPGLLLSLGKGAGLAGVLGLAAIAVSELVNHWDSLRALWTDDGPLQAQIQKQKELKKAVDDAKAAVDAQIDALRRAEGAGSPEGAEIVRAAIQEAGGVDATVENARKALMGFDPELAAARADSLWYQKRAKERRAKDPNGILGEDYYNEGVAESQAKAAALENSMSDRARKTVAEAALGKEDSIRALAALLPGASFAQATPEAVKRQNQEVDAVAEEAERRRKGGERRRARNARVDALNEAGREGERTMAAQVAANAEIDRREGLRRVEAANVASSDRSKTDFSLREERREGREEYARLQEESARVQEQAQNASIWGADLTPFIQSFQSIGRRMSELEARNAQLNQRLSGQFSGQAAGAQPSALPIYQGGSF